VLTTAGAEVVLQAGDFVLMLAGLPCVISSMDPAPPADMARTASLSRPTFFARFQQAVGMAPMACQLAWRMAQGKSLLRQRETVAARVGYGSASAFSTAFARHVGLPRARCARSQP